jgi:hypothetical protein
MTKLSQIENKESPQILLIYGAPLSGKTSAVAHFAKKYKLHWFDLDGKHQSIYSAIDKQYWENIELFRCVDTPEKPRSASLVLKALSSTKPITFCQAHGDLQCNQCMLAKAPMETFDLSSLKCGEDIIVIDNLSTVSDSTMSKNLGFVDAFTPKVKEYGHYNKQEFTLNNLIAYAKSCGVHVILIAHEAGQTYEDGAEKLTPVCGSKAYSTRIAGKIHHVVRARFHNMKFKLSSEAEAEPGAQLGTVSGRKVKDVESLIQIFTPMQQG